MVKNVKSRNRRQSYVLETKVKIPPKNNKSGYSKYPFAEMKVGQSFLVKNKASGAMSANSKNWSKSTGNGSIKFTVRQIGKDTRIWRIK